MASPVKLTGTKLSPGRNGQVEILCNKNTSMELVLDELPFKKQKLSNKDETSEPKNLGDLTGEKIMDTVYVKVLKFLQEKKLTHTRFGIKTTTTAVVADDTAAIKITFWQDFVDAVKEGLFYKLTNCITSYFNDEIWLNTTGTTKISEIEAYGEVNDGSSLLELTTSQIKLSQVSITQHRQCSNTRCNKSLEVGSSPQEQTMKCQHCLMKQRTSSMKTLTVVTMNTATQTYTMYDKALKQFLQNQNKLDLLEDVDRLEDYLLEIEQFRISHSNNSINEQLERYE